MALSNFGRKKAGAGKLELGLSNFRSWKAGGCARKFAFLENLCYNKRLGVELGARVIPKCSPKFDRKVKAERRNKNLKKSKIYGII